MEGGRLTEHTGFRLEGAARLLGQDLLTSSKEAGLR